MVVTFLENTLNVGISTHALVLHSKFQGEFFETLLGETGGWFFNQKIWIWLETLGYLYFVWFVIFLNMMALQFCK